MKILITGATGFVSQNMIPLLVDRCKDIRILTLNRSLEKAEQLFPADLYANIKHTKADSWDDILMFDPDIVFHLAAYSTASNDKESIEPLISSNITYGIQLLNILGNCPSFKFFLNTGSFAEYRLGATHVNNAYLYSATKTAFRIFLDYYSELHGFKYITAVPYTIYGGKPTIKRLMDYLMESIDSPKPVDMTKGGQILDFIHVNDVASFYIHVINNFKKYLQLRNGEEFFLGTGYGTKIRDVASIIEKITGKKCNINWGGRPYRSRDIMHAVAPVAHNMELTGWHSEVSIYEGIANYINNML